VVLVLFVIAPASAAVHASERHKILSKLITASILIVLIYTPIFVNQIFRSYDLRLTLNYPIGKEREYLTARPNEENYRALEAINSVAPTGSIILLLTYPRFWLRPDLLSNDVCSEDFIKRVIEGWSADFFWRYALGRDVKYVVLDKVAFNKISFREIKESAGTYNIRVNLLFDSESVVCFEIVKNHAKMQFVEARRHASITV